jgi:spoIIIJ-associated protein
VEWVVTTGKSVEEAKDAALDELGVDEQDAEFEILEEPRLGLFGRQRGEARVRARVRPRAPRPKTDRRERRRRKPDGSGRDAGGAEDDGGREQPAAATAPASQPKSSPSATASSSDRRDGGPAGDGAEGGAAEGATVAARPRRRRRSRRSGAARAAAEGNGAQEDPDEAGEPAEDGGMMGEQELDLAQQADVAESFVRGLLERFTLPAETTTVTVDEETIEVQVTGPELGLLIGPKGQTLQAVQELTRTAVQRKASNRTGRILVDVAGYRVRRREALERFTRQVAEDVATSRVQRVLEPMSAADRKIVHDTANTIGGVRTISEGEDPHRRVVILPQDGDQDILPVDGEQDTLPQDGEQDEAPAADEG